MSEYCLVPSANYSNSSITLPFIFYIKVHLWFFWFAKRFGLAFDGIDMAESSAVDDDLAGLKIVASAE
jgi:hypothetical protein